MKAWNFWIAVCLAIGATACSEGAVPPQNSSPAAGSQTAGEPAHLLVDVKGEVLLKRAGWSEYARALFGSPVRSGDLLKLEGGAQARVACADLTLVSMTTGITGAPCQVERPILTYKGSPVSATRAAPPGEYPTIVAPRKTRLLDPRPILRWTEVPGATSYQVTIRGPNLEWSAQTSDTELAYPENAPALAPGGSYKLSVEANGRSSDEEGTPGLGFSLLTAEEAQRVREAESRIEALDLQDMPKRLLRANLYASHDLMAEAIQNLEAVAAASNEPAVLRLLGESYLKIGLNFRAADYYLQALEASRQANDLEGQAVAHWMVGQLYETMGDDRGAAEHMQAAMSQYRTLGDSSMVKQIEDQLGRLQAP